MTRVLSSLAVFLFISQAIFAQTNLNWKSKPGFSNALPVSLRGTSKPVAQAELDENGLRTLLLNQKSADISLLMPDGSYQSFALTEHSVMHPDLAAKYPMIRTFKGRQKGDPKITVRVSVTEQGLDAMVRSAGNDPIMVHRDASGSNNYISYRKSAATKPQGWECAIDGIKQNVPAANTANRGSFSDCKYRTYRLALACTGEYAAFHGGTNASVMSAMVATMTRVNGVFEDEIALHLEMVPNNNLLIHLNAATDPYTNNDGVAMLAENQTEIDTKILEANYDIGHVFSTGGGGVAYTGAVCAPGFKAGGVTGLSDPVGDAFDIDFVCHEMGHQLSANHTMNNDCNREPLTAMEPGSGTTIMAYAGVCPPNVQLNSDPFFHSASLDEMGNFLTAGFGTFCGTSTTTANAAPIANAGLDYTIPKSTPFTLTGTATDANDATLYYSWEQINNEVNTQPPTATNTAGPQFRVYTPTTSPKRTLPRMSDVLAGTNYQWEVLPSVARSLDFSFVARDWNAVGGCTSHDTMKVTVAASGPFVMTSLNALTTINSPSTQTITWDVAGTNMPPVSCSSIDIMLSTDGGTTFPTVLATGAPNNGSATVSIPAGINSTTARVMLKCSNNIFFDVNNRNITIAASAASVDATAIITNAKCGDANGAIAITPSGGTSPYTYAWTPGSATTATVTALAAGTYTVTVTDATTASVVKTYTVGGTTAPDINQLDVYDASGTASDNKACDGIPVNFGAYNVSGLGTGPVVWAWTVGAGATVNASGNSQFEGITTNNTTNNPILVPVKVLLTDSLGCKDSMMVNISANPKVNIFDLIAIDNSGTPADFGLCFGDSIQFTVQVTPPLGTYTYAWSSGQTTGQVNIAPPYTGVSTVYSVTVTDDAGCTTAQFTSAKGFPDLVVTPTYTDVCPDTDPDMLVLNLIGGGPFPGATYQLFTEGNTVGEFSTSPFSKTFTLPPGEIYDVLVRDEKGCEVPIAITVPPNSCGSPSCSKGSTVVTVVKN
jgi:Metallo-peptidase family M12/SprB repeat